MLNQDWSSGGDLEFPFYFRQQQSAIEIHYNSHFEGTSWRPARFTRRQKLAQVDNDRVAKWLRNSRLFSLKKDQSALFKINYYHGHRTLAGASIAPIYQQFEGYFINTDKPTANLFERDYTYERDELLILR